MPLVRAALSIAHVLEETASDDAEALAAAREAMPLLTVSEQLAAQLGPPYSSAA